MQLRHFQCPRGEDERPDAAEAGDEKERQRGQLGRNRAAVEDKRLEGGFEQQGHAAQQHGRQPDPQEARQQAARVQAGQAAAQQEKQREHMDGGGQGRGQAKLPDGPVRAPIQRGLGRVQRGLLGGETRFGVASLRVNLRGKLGQARLGIRQRRIRGADLTERVLARHGERLQQRGACLQGDEIMGQRRHAGLSADDRTDDRVVHDDEDHGHNRAGDHRDFGVLQGVKAARQQRLAGPGEDAEA